MRTVGEFEAGHIPGAENVPIDQLTSVATTWDRKQPVVVYCATGARSLNAASWLAANGFETVYNLKDGIVAWEGDVTSSGTASTPAEVTPTSRPVVYEFFTEW